jgi:hypothetical protein
MVWIFGYGSLVWKTQFPFVRKVVGYVRYIYIHSLGPMQWQRVRAAVLVVEHGPPRGARGSGEGGQPAPRRGGQSGGAGGLGLLELRL